MSITNLRAAFEAALNTLTGAIPIAWENTVYSPVDGQPYMQPSLLLTDPKNSTIANSQGLQLTREEGIFQVTLQYPMGYGAAAAYAQAELIRATFKRSASFTSGAVTATVSRTPTIAPGRVDGDRWSVPVKISFFANVFA